MHQPGHVTQVVSDYARREPDGSDAWTPLADDFELALRLCLFYAMRQALRLVTVPA